MRKCDSRKRPRSTSGLRLDARQPDTSGLRLDARHSRRRLTLEALEPRQLMAGDMVLDWNDIIGVTIRADTTQPGPTFASRNYAIVHAAIYDAVNNITRSHTPYLVDDVAPYYASPEAAVAAAAHTALVGLYPQQAANLNAALAASLAEIPDGREETAGVAVGQSIAQQILALRANDGAFASTNYAPANLPGRWKPAAPLLQVGGLGPQWGSVTPFALESGDQFRGGPPPAMESAEYAAAVNEVMLLGERNSAVRTADQTEIGIFWGYDRGGLGPPPILYNQIAQTISLEQENTLEENARLFVLLNVAQADAGIACWETKYFYDLWRPIHAIREADTDNNPLTIADPDWEPLGAPGGGVVPDFTPPFPAYGSGHSTFGAAVFRSLANFYGTDAYEFDARSDELPGVVRHYTSFSQAAEENARSRIYLGIHYNFDDTAGRAMGNDIADYVFENCFQEFEPEPADLVAAAGAGGGPHVRVMHDSGQIMHEFFAYNPQFTGGVRVAMGDLTGDGFDEVITAPGPTGGPHIKVFDGQTAQLLRQFMAYDPRFSGGVHVASGDVNGDGLADIITGADAGGGPHVRVFSGLDGSQLASFFAYNPAFGGGVRVAAADVDGDGDVEILTGAGAGGGPHVRAFRLDLTEATPGFFAYSSNFAGGVFVAGGDLDGDGNAEIITTPGAGGQSRLRAFDMASGATVLDFPAYNPSFTGEVHVATADIDGDGRADVIAAPGFDQNSTVRMFQGYSAREIARFRAFANFGGGVYAAGGLGGHPVSILAAPSPDDLSSSLSGEDLQALLIGVASPSKPRSPSALAADLVFAIERA